MVKVIHMSDYIIKKILGNMSDIVINDRKRERLLGDIMKFHVEQKAK
jgi:hypothetical protein